MFNCVRVFTDRYFTVRVIDEDQLGLFTIQKDGYGPVACAVIYTENIYIVTKIKQGYIKTYAC